MSSNRTNNQTGTDKTPNDNPPHIEDATIPEEGPNQTVEVSQDNRTPYQIIADASNGEIPNDPGEGMIVHRTNYVDQDGTYRTKEHGPMPRSDWAAYEREHNL